MSQRIMAVNEAERTWIAGNQRVVRSFAIERGVLPYESAPVDPPVLDAAWAAWLEMHVRGEEDPNSIINAFGISFGQVLVDRLGLEWKVVSDVVTDIALCGQPGDIVIYPQNLVARRYIARSTRFFAELATEMERTVGRLPRQAAEPIPATTAVPEEVLFGPSKAFGPGRLRRPAIAVGPGRPEDMAAAASMGPVPAEPFVAVERVVVLELPEPQEAGAGGFGRTFRRGDQ
ncbi:MAG TPA: DUF3806 domain-containing protein [Candidatus Limnocylindrales bacterium]